MWPVRTKITGDAFAGEWTSAAFGNAGVKYETFPQTETVRILIREILTKLANTRIRGDTTGGKTTILRQTDHEIREAIGIGSPLLRIPPSPPATLGLQRVPSDLSILYTVL